MSSLTTRVARCLVALAVASLLGCQAENRLAPDGPGTPPPDLARYAFYLDIDVANGTVRVVSPEPAQTRASGRLAYSLAGSEIVGMTTSNFFRSAIGQFVANKRTITFDLTLSNKLSVTDLVTPTFPLPPPGVQGIIAFPYTVAAYGVSGGMATPDANWNGTGAANSGRPFNFFNDFGVCGTTTTSDCYRWEAFPTPLNPGQSTPAHKVGFTVDKNVTNVGAYVVVAADFVDHPPPPPQPGLGALSGVVTSASLGLLGGVAVALAPGGQSAVTDGVGRYLFTGLPVGPFTVTVSGLPSGCTTPASVTGTIVSGGLATANVDVACQPTTGSISGMATSPEVGPLASATVELLQAGATTPVSQTTTNAAGAFTFSSVTPGSYVVQLVGLTPPCPSTAGPVAVTVTAGNTSTPLFSVSCVAIPSGTLYGQVFISQFGQYALQFSISSSGGGPTVLVYSDPVTESFGPITIAAGQVTVSAIGFPGNCTPPFPQTVPLAAGAVFTVRFLVMCGAVGTTGTINGIATSPEVGPLAAATVQLLQPGTLTLVAQTPTYPQGEFSFGGIAPGSYLLQLVGLTPPCPATTGPMAVTVIAGTIINPTLSVSCLGNAAPLLTGVVTSSTGDPLGGVEVTASSLAGSFTALTDASGAFSFDSRILVVTGLPTSVSLAITAGLPAGCTAPTTPTTVLVSAGTQASVNFDVTCLPTGAISGTATSPELGPIGSATVQLLPGTGLPPIAQTTTDAAGGFHFATVAPGSYSVQLVGLAPPCPATGGPVSVTVTAGTTSTANISVSCVATGSGTISGSVTSPQLGGIGFAAIAASSSSSGATASGQTDLLGAYGPIPIEAGQVTVSASGLPSNCTPPSAQTVTLAANGAATVDFVVDCPAAGTPQITVQLTSPQLGPLPGVNVSFSSLFSSFNILTDGTGSATLNTSLLPSGFIEIQPVGGLPPGCATPLPIIVPIPTSATLLVPISVACSVASGTGGLNLLVANVQALPLAEALLVLSGPSGYQLRTATDPSGVLLLSGLAPGDYSAVLLGLPTTCTPSPLSFTISAGAVTQTSYMLQCAISVVPGVIGDVISPTLGFLSAVSVDLYEGGGFLGSTQTDVDGVFSFPRDICGTSNCQGHLLTASISPTNSGLPPTCTVPQPIALTGKGSGFFVLARFSVDCS